MSRVREDYRNRIAHKLAELQKPIKVNS